MKKEERVKSNILFNNIIRKGKKISNEFFTIFYCESNNLLFGVSSPKKLGNAVMRNKLRRQTRALIDDLKLSFKNNNNYIIIIKEGCINASYEKRKNALISLIGEIK